MTTPMFPGTIILPEQKPIAIRNAWLIRSQLLMFSDADNDWVPWVGSDARGRLSLYADGYDLTGAVSTLSGPYAMTATGEPGWYYAVISSENVTSALSNYVGRLVYQIVEAGYGSTYYALTVSQPLQVIDPRSPIR